MSKQNKIGRPPGSSRLNPEDDLHLHRVADRMILDSSLKLTQAMVAVGIDSETTRRRLRRKWKPVSERYLREARQRREAAAAEQMRQTLQQIGEMAGRFMIGAGIISEQIRAGLARWADENRDTVAGVRAAAEQIRTLQLRVASAKALGVIDQNPNR
jgi:hypothetical protein